MKTFVSKREQQRQPGFEPSCGCLSKSVHGFTLIETIIAMSLVALLMAVIWSMFRVYTRLEEKGVSAAQDVALLRALHGQMREDLIRIVPCRPDRIATTIDNESRNDSQENSFVENGFFIGNEREIHFVIVSWLNPERRAVLKVVSYQPASALANEADDENVDLFGGPAERPQGMERRERSLAEFARQKAMDDQMRGIATAGREIELDADDFLVIGAEDRQEDVDGETETWPDVVDSIPEVSRHRFRFFDGLQWQSEWDSAFALQLPVAVEFEMNLDARNRQNFDEQEARDPTQKVVSGRDVGQPDPRANQLSTMDSAREDLLATNLPLTESPTSDFLSMQPEPGLDRREDRLSHRWMIAIETVPKSSAENESYSEVGNAIGLMETLP